MKIKDSITFLSVFVVVVLIVVAGFIFQRTPPAVIKTYLTPNEAKQLISGNSNLVVIDVSPYFYKKGHLPGALNYPKCALVNVIMGFDKDKTYLIYCHGFGSPQLSAMKLRQAGFKNVYTLLGNYVFWVDAGYPIEY